MNSNEQRFFPWLMWFFPVSFFAFQFILRLFPGLVMPEFLQQYNITANDFGTFAALYYLGYAGMQIPMAILLEKYGPRVVIGLSAILCGFATCLFIMFDSWPIALLSRFLIGVGSVVGFLGTSTVVSQWFPANRYARLIGITFSFGLLGALYGGRPVGLLIQQMGWEKVCLILGSCAILIGLFVLAFVRTKHFAQEKKEPVLKSLKMLITNKPLLLLALGNFLMVGSLEGFADVWGVPYLVSARELSTVDAASIVSFIFVGMLFGGPILAFISEKFKAHHQVTMLSGILMAFLLGIVLLMNAQLPLFALRMVMFLIGVLCCYQVIVFAIGAQLVTPALLGISVAFLNCINMFGGSFFHKSIGLLMDYFEPSLLDATKVYSLSSYTSTLTLIPLAAIVGSFLVWLSNRSSK